jgi:hypothetical protein
MFCVRCLLPIREGQQYDAQVRQSPVGTLYRAYAHVECPAPGPVRVVVSAERVAVTRRYLDHVTTCADCTSGHLGCPPGRELRAAWKATAGPGPDAES